MLRMRDMTGCSNSSEDRDSAHNASCPVDNGRPRHRARGHQVIRRYVTPAEILGERRIDHPPELRGRYLQSFGNRRSHDRSGQSDLPADLMWMILILQWSKNRAP